MEGTVGMLGGLTDFEVYVLLVGTAIMIICFWRIFSKAGYSGAMSLLMLFPILNLIMVMVLAFGRWPIHHWLLSLQKGEALQYRDFDKMMKSALKLETSGELHKALTEYQNIVQDAKTCVTALEAKLAEFENSGA